MIHTLIPYSPWYSTGNIKRSLLLPPVYKPLGKNIRFVDIALPLPLHCQKDTCHSFQLPIILHATVKWFILQELAQASQRSAGRVVVVAWWQWVNIKATFIIAYCRIWKRKKETHWKSGGRHNSNKNTGNIREWYDDDEFDMGNVCKL